MWDYEGRINTRHSPCVSVIIVIDTGSHWFSWAPNVCRKDQMSVANVSLGEDSAAVRQGTMVYRVSRHAEN
jgi:hypothetical protein